MKELIPLPNRIEDIIKTGVSDRDIITKIINTINAGKRNIVLGDFIPTDKDGKPLEKPNKTDLGYFHDHEEWARKDGQRYYDADLKDYETALSKILFKGFTVRDDDGLNVTFNHPYSMNNAFYWNHNRGIISGQKTIEDIAYLNLSLTKEGGNRIL